MIDKCPLCGSGLMLGRINRYQCNTSFDPAKGVKLPSKQCLYNRIGQLEEANTRLTKRVVELMGDEHD